MTSCELRETTPVTAATAVAATARQNSVRNHDTAPDPSHVVFPHGSLGNLFALAPVSPDKVPEELWPCLDSDFTL